MHYFSLMAFCHNHNTDIVYFLLTDNFCIDKPKRKFDSTLETPLKNSLSKNKQNLAATHVFVWNTNILGGLSIRMLQGILSPVSQALRNNPCKLGVSIKTFRSQNVRSASI